MNQLCKVFFDSPGILMGMREHEKKGQGNKMFRHINVTAKHIGNVVTH